MVMPSFRFGNTPRIHFGPGSFNLLGKLVEGLGKKALVVTGVRSLRSSGKMDALLGDLRGRGIAFHHIAVEGEPTPEYVDQAVSQYGGEDIQVVLAVGGGSVIDAGKAISAMLPQGGSVMDYLEGVGEREHSGVKVPFIAVPTTAGTGSEATRNAVLRRVGPRGFKKSLRHENFTPEVAVVDPELALSCPSHLTAWCGMDAFTQLLESYLSTLASPLTDALAWGGMELARGNLVAACGEGANDVDVRGAMACAALISGITLANAGLGIVHGFASAIGGFFDIPHGVACGTLLAPSIQANIQALKEIGSPGEAALFKYAKVGCLLKGLSVSDIPSGCDYLVETLRRWTEELEIPRLGDYGIGEEDVERIISETGAKNNPVELDQQAMRAILLERI